MKTDSTLLSECKSYAVDFDSTLGVAIKTYIARCIIANDAVTAFLDKVQQDFNFPVQITEDTQYLTSDDADAGGLIGIVVSQEVVDALDTKQQAMWDWFPLDSEEIDKKAFVLFPRIDVITRYIKYVDAIRLFNDNAPDWEFMPPSPTDKAKKRPVRSVILADVKRIIHKADLDALATKGKPAAPNTRLASARHFFMNMDSLKAIYPDDEKAIQQFQKFFPDALRLYKVMSQLPSVPANSLARTLQLSGKEIKHPYCEWKADNETRRYIITTNLSSPLAEMKEL